MRSPCRKRLATPARLGTKSSVPGPSVWTLSIDSPPTRIFMRMVSLRRMRVSGGGAPGCGTGSARATLLPEETALVSVLSFSVVSKSRSIRSPVIVVRVVLAVETRRVLAVPAILLTCMLSAKVMSRRSAANSTLRPGSSRTPLAFCTSAVLMWPLSRLITDIPASICSVSRVSLDHGNKITLDSRSR